jgi:hypothetical protein
MNIVLYTFESKDGHEAGTFQTHNSQEAKEYAQQNGLRVVENIFEFSESIPIPEWDYTGQDDDE